MLSIKSREDLRLALRRLRRFQAREQQGRRLYEKYRDMVVRYMETKNRKVVEDSEGNRWQKRQAVKIVYPENAHDLNKLLRRKGVDPHTVISFVRPDPIIVVDEEEILRLLKTKAITPAEYEKVIIRQTYTPFIVRLPNEKERKRSKKKPAKSRRRD